MKMCIAVLAACVGALVVGPGLAQAQDQRGIGIYIVGAPILGQTTNSGANNSAQRKQSPSKTKKSDSDRGGYTVANGKRKGGASRGVLVSPYQTGGGASEQGRRRSKGASQGNPAPKAGIAGTASMAARIGTNRR